MLPLTERFRSAVDYALQTHREHGRKDSRVPYAAHLFSVAALAMEHGADEDEAIAALLHDAVEDCGGLARLEDIRRRFGARVADIVLGCSDSVAADPEDKAPWRERKEHKIESLAVADASVRLVSACDKLHNARDTLSQARRDGARVWARFHREEPDLARKRQSVLWYLRSMSAVFQEHGPRDLGSELARVVDELEALGG